MTLIEKVATALADLPGDPSSLDMARAAIKAMREPTKQMLGAEMNLGGYGFYVDECISSNPTEIWQAMIDAALREFDNA